MKLVTDPPELHKASRKFATLADDYTGVYNRLLNTASNMGAAWKSADNLAFVDQINGFCDDLKAMTDHLLLASQALEKQAVNYESTRDHNASIVKQLAN